jgi:asparagine synthase (glutamine-hydrolysing)
MCGICGVFNCLPPKEADTQLLKKMCSQLVHRGPDDEGIRSFGPAGLGFRRLSIIDLKGGRQPMANEDETVWVVFNGEIYNFRELRSDLEAKGHQFKTSSDTETIVHGYEVWGDSVVEHLRGMFALAVWDARRKRLFLARDRLGKKPLYYAWLNGSLYFASEIKALLQVPDLGREVDLSAIDLYLSYQYIPSPQTIFKGIFRLPPASALACGPEGKIDIKKYWDLNFISKTAIRPEEAAQEIRRLLKEATRLRMVADVPLGAFLSGGIDSSAVVGTMAELSSRPVQTFSIGFEEKSYSELPFARLVAERFKTDHHEFIVKPDMMAILPRIIWHYDQPFADASALPSFFVAEETRRHVTVALNGDGGDETFGGYQRYGFESLFIRWSGRIPAPLRKGLALASQALPERWMGQRLYRRLKRALELSGETVGDVNLQLFCYFNQKEKARLYGPRLAPFLKPPGAPAYLRELYTASGSSDLLDQIFYADFHGYLPEDLLVKIDVATMAHSLEGRSPFLDHKLVEFAASLPSDWKVRGVTTKRILKESLRGFIPDPILNRPKMGFGIPLKEWFEGRYFNLLKDILLDQDALKRGYFREEALRTLLEEHQMGKRDHGYRLWALLVLELWHRMFIDKTLTPSSYLQ